MFKKIAQAFGIGGPTVDTVLHQPATQPGGVIGGEVRITGGDNARDVNSLTVSLAATVEVESGDEEYDQRIVFANQVVAGQGQLAPKAQVALPFQLQVPWESPFNALRGYTFHKMRIGVQTRFDLPGGLDATDFDPIDIHALPIHVQAIEALERMGFQLKNADLERGRVPGSTLGFYNEIEFRGHGQVPECELTFVTGPQETHIILEVDKASLFGSGDRLDSVTVPTAGGVDLQQVLGQRIQALVSRGGRFF